MAETPVWRPTARLLVVDPDQRVLLFSSINSAGKTWWFTPGGGVHRGETVTEAAIRELSEETGFACTEAELGPVVATSSALLAGRTRRDAVPGRPFVFLPAGPASSD